MSTSSTLSPQDTDTNADGHADGHDGHDDHHPHLAHHFEDLDQQFEAGKLGIWLFLAQEVLFFSGLFAAYTVYRYHHPEVFVNAHHHLNTTLGAINTVVLLASSLAIAWGVRAAMRSDRATILYTHVFTLFCAALFMGVKTVEYTHKWDEGIYPAGFYSFVEGAHASHGYWHERMPGILIGCLVAGIIVTLYGAGRASAGAVVRGWVLGSIGISLIGIGGGIVLAKCIMPTAQEMAHSDSHGGAHGESHGDAHSDHSADGHSEELKTEGMTPEEMAVAEGPTDADTVIAPEVAGMQPPTLEDKRFAEKNFFSIYFVMTGVHAIHIIAGMIAITWIIARTAANHFSAEYYGPVEFVGLYWHLVDLVWIYLFPLLYLIH